MAQMTLMTRWVKGSTRLIPLPCVKPVVSDSVPIPIEYVQPVSLDEQTGIADHGIG